jgi:hypothetical protein
MNGLIEPSKGMKIPEECREPALLTRASNRPSLPFKKSSTIPEEIYR